MNPNPKGIFDVIGKFFNPAVDNAINAAEESGSPGPEKKLNVINMILNFLGLRGWVAEIIEQLLGSFIDGIVSKKNKSGEFTHRS